MVKICFAGRAYFFFVISGNFSFNPLRTFDEKPLNMIHMQISVHCMFLCSSGLKIHLVWCRVIKLHATYNPLKFSLAEISPKCYSNTSKSLVLFLENDCATSYKNGNLPNSTLNLEFYLHYKRLIFRQSTTFLEVL